MINKPILITGVPRSGTSLTAAMIHYGGAFGGDMALPNRNKRNAMLENTTIRQNFVKPYLKELGVDPMGQNPLPRLQDLELWDRLIEDGKNIWRDKIINLMKSQGYKEGPWFYKGPKMALIWPLWHAAFPEAQWIIVHRDKRDIINSCFNTAFMRAYNDYEGWGKWVDHHKACFADMQNAHLDITHVYPDKMIKGNFVEMSDVVRYFKLEWHEAKAKALINPKFWGGKT